MGILRAIGTGNVALSTGAGLTAEVHAIRTHIGNFTVLVELLGGSHGGLAAKAKLGIGILLQGTGGKGRTWATRARGGLDIGNGKMSANQLL